MSAARTRRKITWEEHVVLIELSDPEHPVWTSFGPAGVWLLPDPINDWAFELLEAGEAPMGT